MRLLGGHTPKAVAVSLPGKRHLDIPVECVGPARDGGVMAVIIKDGGDDPDCTHGAEIIARVNIKTLTEGGQFISITGGQGVGKVTRPGLAVQPGEWAINPVPRKMISWAVEEVLNVFSPFDSKEIRVDVEVSVPRGDELALQTLNPRLGIVGGISILGTTGLVKPFSHGAYRATIFTALRAARANGISEIFLVTGSQTDTYARMLNPGHPEIAFCQMADYVKFAMRCVSRLGFSRVHIYSFFGKALKMAQGLPQTHASRGSVDLDFLKDITIKTRADIPGEIISRANTARHALQIIKEHGETENIISSVGRLALGNLQVYIKKNIHVVFTILDFDGKILWQGNQS